MKKNGRFGRRTNNFAACFFVGCFLLGDGGFGRGLLPFGLGLLPFRLELLPFEDEFPPFPAEFPPFESESLFLQVKFTFSGFIAFRPAKSKGIMGLVFFKLVLDASSNDYSL
ncbi:hypothetical protein FK545_15335 [Planococcus glaciei]|nr:hypothetical protein [Planococcus glaciei]QDY46236.1 hypothetical protein FK545_15335 [Planococcus glaciei]